MTLFKNVNGERIEISAEEEKTIKAEWTQNKARVIPPISDPDLLEAIKILGRNLTGQDSTDFEIAMNRKRNE